MFQQINTLSLPIKAFMHMQLAQFESVEAQCLFFFSFSCKASGCERKTRSEMSVFSVSWPRFQLSLKRVVVSFHLCMMPTFPEGCLGRVSSWPRQMGSNQESLKTQCQRGSFFRLVCVTGCKNNMFLCKVAQTQPVRERLFRARNAFPIRSHTQHQPLRKVLIKINEMHDKTTKQNIAHRL